LTLLLKRLLQDAAGDFARGSNMPWKTFVAAGTLVVRDNKLLLARTLRDGVARWEITAGHQQPGETLEETAARETFEETGIAVAAGALVCTYLLQRTTEERRILCAYFVGVERVPGSRPIVQATAEILEVDFLDPLKLGAGELHPVDQTILKRWWPERAWLAPFHLHFEK
jgi:8-oxo-dGTP pyrophosphatase MutT (NUDIX family)